MRSTATTIVLFVSFFVAGLAAANGVLGQQGLAKLEYTHERIPTTTEDFIDAANDPPNLQPLYLRVESATPGTLREGSWVVIMTQATFHSPNAPSWLAPVTPMPVRDFLTSPGPGRSPFARPGSTVDLLNHAAVDAQTEDLRIDPDRAYAFLDQLRSDPEYVKDYGQQVQLNQSTSYWYPGVSYWLDPAFQYTTGQSADLWAPTIAPTPAVFRSIGYHMIALERLLQHTIMQQAPSLQAGQAFVTSQAFYDAVYTCNTADYFLLSAQVFVFDPGTIGNPNIGGSIFTTPSILSADNGFDFVPGFEINISFCSTEFGGEPRIVAPPGTITDPAASFVYFTIGVASSEYDTVVYYDEEDTPLLTTPLNWITPTSGIASAVGPGVPWDRVEFISLPNPQMTILKPKDLFFAAFEDAEFEF